MSQIVEDLLLLSKTDTGEIRLNKEDINLTIILNEVVAQMDILAKSKGLRLSTSNHHHPIYIFGDALRLRELFINLIENSIKYTEEGGSIHIVLEKGYFPPVEGHSELVDRKEGEFVKIVVSDTGIGIAKEDQEKIFNRFFRVDKARSREQGGSGLGLNICKWIVEAHQGEIKVESELGKGSSFIVKLPLTSPRMII
jgi:signal transduction histidine kinase